MERVSEWIDEERADEASPLTHSFTHSLHCTPPPRRSTEPPTRAACAHALSNPLPPTSSRHRRLTTTAPRPTRSWRRRRPCRTRASARHHPWPRRCRTTRRTGGASHRASRHAMRRLRRLRRPRRHARRSRCSPQQHRRAEARARSHTRGPVRLAPRPRARTPSSNARWSADGTKKSTAGASRIGACRHGVSPPPDLPTQTRSQPPEE